MIPKQPAIWFPAIRAGSGTDVFTERLVEGLRYRGLRAEITWLPHRAEYAPWTVTKVKPPAWANIAHVNTWLPRKFIPTELPFVATMHHCIHDPSLEPYKIHLQSLYHRFWVRRIEYEVLTHANQIIAISHYTAQRTKEEYRVSNIHVIHNGIELEELFHPGNKKKRPHKPFRLLYVGNWSSRKGTDLLAPIMKQLGADFELYYTANRQNNTSADKLPPNTYSLKHLTTTESLVEAYRNADVLLFPTRLEGFGLVALEAQACGLPVIATHGSSLPEVVEHEKTGLLCPQDDISAFVNAARKLADDTELWQRMGKVGRKRAEEYFGLEKMIEQYITAYRRILARL